MLDDKKMQQQQLCITAELLNDKFKQQGEEIKLTSKMCSFSGTWEEQPWPGDQTYFSQLGSRRI